MGYRVDYRPVKKIRGAEKRHTGLPAMIAVWFLLFVLLVNAVWPRGAEVMRGFFFSGDAEVTAAALETMAVDLKNGKPLPAALEAFCIAVFEHAETGSG